MAFHRRRRLVGLRVLRRTPAFFIAAVLTLGLGVGVITTAYSVLDAAIIAALPFKADSRLIRLYHDAPAEQGGRQNLSLADFLAVRDKTPGLAAAATYRVFDALVAESTSINRFRAFVLTLLSGAALGLAAIGIYGIAAYATRCRTREIGVRLALGAQPRAIASFVLREGLRNVVLGAGLGLIGSLAAARFVRGLLVGVVPADGVSIAAAVVTLVGAGFVACWLPARRAASIDPVVALRAE